jgi:hypothetical protein
MAKYRLVYFINKTWRLLILPYPAEIRIEYGTEMVRVFRDLYRSLRAQRGIGGVMAFWFYALSDILTTVPIEYTRILLRELRDTIEIVRQQPAARKAIVSLSLGIGITAFGYGAPFYIDQQPSFLSGGAMGVIHKAISGLSIYLLVACTNMSSFLLVEAVSRQKNTSLRKALEADRYKVNRQLFTKSILISVLGGIIGLFLTSISIIGFAGMSTGNIKAVAINPTALGFIVLLLTLISAFLQKRSVKITLSEIQHVCTTQLPLDHRNSPEVASLV